MFTRWKGPKSMTEHATHVLVVYCASLLRIQAHQVFYSFMSQEYNSPYFCFSLGKVVNYCMCIVNNITLVDYTTDIQGISYEHFKKVGSQYKVPLLVILH